MRLPSKRESGQAEEEHQRHSSEQTQSANLLRELEDFPRDIWDAARRGSTAGVQYYWAEDPGCEGRKKADYWTPLHYAADQGHLATAALLLRLGAGVDPVDPNGHTPLLWACINENLPMLELLLDAGADLDHQCLFTYTPLHWAAMKNNLSALQLLVRRGADHTVVCRRGQTPLSLACEQDQRDCALHLISMLSLAKDIDHIDIRMDTPLTLASWNGHLPVINALLDKGAIINHRNVDQASALHCAVYGGHLPAVNLLVRRGAEHRIRDASQRTPLDIAQEQELYDIAYYLLMVDHLFNLYYDMEYDRLTLPGPPMSIRHLRNSNIFH